MRKKGIRILGTGSYLPSRIVTNEDLESVVFNFDPEKAGRSFVSWAEDVTGIRERRFVEDETAEDMAREASLKAIESSMIEAGEVDFVIACTFTPSRLIPNMGCTIAKMTGVGRKGGYALNTACGGFVYGLSMAYALIMSDVYDTILVVASEALSRTIGMDDPKTAILFGDGAAGVVVRGSADGGMTSAPCMLSEYSDHIAFDNAMMKDPVPGVGDAGAQYVEKDYIRMPGGPMVLRRAISAMAEAAEKALEESEWALADIDWLVPHQANRRITLGLAEKMGMPMEKVVDTVAFHGNTSGASIPLALDTAVRGMPEAGGMTIERGDKVLMTAVGGGYSIAAAVLEY